VVMSLLRNRNLRGRWGDPGPARFPVPADLHSPANYGLGAPWETHYGEVRPADGLERTNGWIRLWLTG